MQAILWAESKGSIACMAGFYRGIKGVAFLIISSYSLSVNHNNNYAMPISNHRSHALRQGRFSIPHQIYSITVVTRERLPVFEEFKAARSLIQVLREHDIRGNSKTLCFVVMPDHLHWLMQLGDSKNLSTTVQSVKSITSKCCGWSVWQRGFHDRAIRRDEDILTVARYIIANPIRAGLVKNIREYSHWDAVWIPTSP